MFKNIITEKVKGEYASAVATAFIPGAGWASSAARNVTEAAILYAEDAINGEETSVSDVITGVIIGTATDKVANNIADKGTDFINRKRPDNYSTFAHDALENDPTMEREEISKSMKKFNELLDVINNGWSYLVGLGSEFLNRVFSNG